MLIGINGHPLTGYTLSIAKQILLLRDLGAEIYRVDIKGPEQARAFVDLFVTFRAAGITLLPVLTPAFGYSEAIDFANGRNLAAAIAYYAKGAVTRWELGNEYDVRCIKGPQYNGDKPSHYDTVKFLRCRAALRGMQAGLKQYLPNAIQLIGSGGWRHTAFPEMLWNGTRPDGVSEPTMIVRWNETVLHWYSSNKDITAVGGDTTFNALARARAFGKPVVLTEIGENLHLGDRVAQANYLGAILPDYKDRLIPEVDIYELLDFGASKFGIVSADGLTRYPAFDVIKKFITSL